MPSKNERLLPARALSWNVLSGNVSSPTIMKIPLVTNTGRLPLVTGGVPFSMTRGVMPGLKHDRKAGANRERLENASGLTKDGSCPWCGEGNIARELKSDKSSLWRCLGCHRRWWASPDNPRKMPQHRPKLSQQVYQGSFWKKLGGIGW